MAPATMTLAVWHSSSISPPVDSYISCSSPTKPNPHSADGFWEITNDALYCNSPFRCVLLFPCGLRENASSLIHCLRDWAHTYERRAVHHHIRPATLILVNSGFFLSGAPHLRCAVAAHDDGVSNFRATAQQFR